jgi:nucleoside-diphosphate-sugar epimerase
VSGPVRQDFIGGPDDCILVTGASGFIGRRVVTALLNLHFRKIRCLVRSIHSAQSLVAMGRDFPGSELQVVVGNLLSAKDCEAAADGAAIVYHLAAARGEKSYPEAFLNSVVTTRNLVEACVKDGRLRRFVSISSFAVYTNRRNPGGRTLDERSPVEERPELRGNAYCFAKVEQDRLVVDYARRLGVPYVLVRPGWVYGPGNPAIHSRVGIGTFGIFLHLGGGNTMPLTYVDNCADAIVLAGLQRGVENEVFNVIDDDLPSSRTFLRLYKERVRRFRSIYLPHALTYLLCAFWEWFSTWSERQVPRTYNRALWHATWKRTIYSNAKLKARLAWQQRVSTNEGLQRHFEGCRTPGARA